MCRKCKHVVVDILDACKLYWASALGNGGGGGGDAD